MQADQLRQVLETYHRESFAWLNRHLSLIRCMTGLGHPNNIKSGKDRVDVLFVLFNVLIIDKYRVGLGIEVEAHKGIW